MREEGGVVREGGEQRVICEGGREGGRRVVREEGEAVREGWRLSEGGRGEALREGGTWRLSDGGSG